MLNIREKRHKYYSVLFFATLLFFLSGFTVFAFADNSPKVLRVAFPQLKGMTETAEDGTRHGLVVDYLNEISKYTGWEYEYVDVESAIEMLEDFSNGKYDLMGGQYYLPGFEEYYAYPDFNTGYSRATLIARWNDRSIRANDLESLNGKTIGVYERATENIRRLKEFLNLNGLDCTLRYFTYEEMSDTEDFYPYLRSEEVDLLLGNLSEDNKDFRVVVSYNSQPYYIVTTVGNQEVLDGLNMALDLITDSNPDFAAERYAANFPDMAVGIQLTDQELEYIRQKVSLVVAIPQEWHPLSCQTSVNDLHNGLVPDIFSKISEFTGLEFSYVYTKNYIDSINLVQQGKADILGFYLGTEADSSEQGLVLTAAYANMANIVVRNKSASYPSDELIAATVQGWPLPVDVPVAEVHTYKTSAEALSAVNKGDADLIYGLSARLEQEIQRYQFSNLVPVTLGNEMSDICLALARPVDPKLLTILNKAINTLPTEEKNALLNQNMVSIGTTQFSLTELIYANPVMFVVILTVLLTIIATSVLLAARARVRAAVIQTNLEKAEAESRAKGEFLSRMSHEIRTPMNAVVGLADLTSMLEGVPDNVKQNLTKIRTSSRYLLSLINDILDMGRIDNGMLSIASEPFSIEQMLADLRSMMESEAQRKGLTFILEDDFTHSELTGDAIRLRQVLTNLLSNAFKFTPVNGTVRLCVKEIDANDKGATFTFQVIDSGIGVKSEDQQRIFDSFEQLGTSSSQSQGTGLGLAISSSIVKLMGGELQLKSEVSKGSEFYFTITLPLGRLDDRLEFLTAESLLKGIHILLAEDNDLNAEITTQLLEIQGASICRCENGKLAVERFAKSEPGEFQLILMDVQMPEMNGLDATRAIRALNRPDAATLPIIAMTASSFQSDVDAAYEAGMNNFISKPLDVSHLYQVLGEILM